MFYPTVFPLSVLPDGNQVHTSVGGFVALDGHAGAHVSIQVKRFPQQQVHRWMASSYWCLQRTCELSVFHVGEEESKQKCAPPSAINLTTSNKSLSPF